MAAVDPPDAAEANGRGQPDPRALAVARALQDYLPDAEIILFGSRATGSTVGNRNPGTPNRHCLRKHRN